MWRITVRIWRARPTKEICRSVRPRCENERRHQHERALGPNESLAGRTHAALTDIAATRNVGTMPDQQLGDFRAPIGGGQAQRRSLERGFCIDFRAVLDQ